jgi:oligopeptidase B
MTAPTPPVARKQPTTIEQLGRMRTDDYAWLKDENWQALLRDPSQVRPDIKAHLDAENAYTKAMLASTEALQAELFAEMKGRVKEDDSSLPSPDGPWDYYSRYAMGAQHPILARRPTGQADGEEILIDVDALAEGHAYYQVHDGEHSPDHALYAYAEDDQGSEYHRIRIKDLATGTLLPDPVESATGDFVWSPDSAWLFWVWRDENGRSAKVFRRPARGGSADDVLVYAEPDEGMFVHAGVTQSRAFITLSSGNHDCSATWLIPAADPTAEPRQVEARTDGVLYSVEHWPTEGEEGRLVILTNADGAVDFKLMWADADQPARTHWREWIPHQPGRFIVGLAARRDYLVRLERVNANNRLVITAREGLTETAVDFDEPAYALSLEGGYDWDQPAIRFVYQSPTTPRSWFDYDLATGERTLRKSQEVPSGHDPARYEARRLYAKAADGEQVPVTVLMQAGAKLDGSAPLLLYGYGAYGLPMDPGFSIRSLSLVDRGWIYAIAHVRGGSEKGWGWFQAGRGKQKPNTFTDFIACAEHLVASGYGQAGRIVAYGGSAGGMLMGAVANLRPDLWAGVIGAVPFVDVLNTMSDATLPLTPPEWPEWGNPLDSAEDYDAIAAYSPYDQVSAQPYPAVLATGGLSDPRVTYWEPAKWAAKLREVSTSTAPILLKINMTAGHGGAAGRFDFLKEIALDYAFAIQAVAGDWPT